jgi:hypothetical protein
MERKQLIEMLSLLCYNAFKDDGNYIIPGLAIKYNPKHKNILSDEGEEELSFASTRTFIFTEPDFIKKINELINRWFDHYHNISDRWRYYTTAEILKADLSKLFFDGMGFYVPCFSSYVNKLPEHQIPNSTTAVDGVIKSYYDFDKDISFDAFILDLHNNLKDIKSWIKTRQLGLQGKKLIDFIYDKNFENRGLEERLIPYIKLIEKRKA